MSTTPETIQISRETEPFVLEKALDNKEFLKYFAASKGEDVELDKSNQARAEELYRGFKTIEPYIKNNKFRDILTQVEGKDFIINEENLERIKELGEVSDAREKATKQTQELYKTALKTELGISLSDKELDTIDEHFTKKMLKDPSAARDFFNDTLKRIDEYHTLPEKIKEAQENIDSFKDEYADLMAEKAKLGKKKKELEGGTVIQKILKAPWRSHIEGKYKNIGEKIKDQGEAIRTKEELEDTLAEAKNTLFKELSIVNEVIKDIKTKARQELDQLADPQKAFTSDKLIKIRDSVQKFKGASFEILTEVEAGKYEKWVEEDSEALIIKEVTDIVSKLKLEEDNPLSKLKKALKDSVEKGKFGVKTKQEGFQFIVDTLREKLDDPSTEKEKKILIKFILNENVLWGQST